MNITERIHEAMMRNDSLACQRCGEPRAAWWIDLTIDPLVESHRVCGACVIDFKIFMITPPERPDQDTSSGNVLEHEGESNDAQS